MKLTQENLAERAGISRQSICNIEQGRQKPSGQKLLSICDVLGLNSIVLCEEEQKNTTQPDTRILALGELVRSLSDEEQTSFYEIACIVYHGISSHGDSRSNKN